MERRDKGAAIVVQPDEGDSFWQPVPANGYASVMLSPGGGASGLFSMGVQVIPPGGMIREHAHDRHEELTFFWQGAGKAIVDGVEHPIVPGTTIFAGRWVKHCFINDGEIDLKTVWVILPPGLEDFFEAIGRRRKPGEPGPEPFPRPENVLEIETRTVYARLDAEGATDDD